MHAMQSSLVTQLIKLPPCGSYKASDTELEATKQWAIDEARFEPSNPPRQHTAAAASEEGMRWPVGRARRYTGCASAHLIRISRITGGC